VIGFQNVNFVYKVSRTTPVEMERGDDLPHFKNLVKFLKTLEENDLLKEIKKNAKVVYADDQFVNVHTVTKNFEDLKIPEKLVTFSNGQDVIDYLESLLTKVTVQSLNGKKLPY